VRRVSAVEAERALSTGTGSAGGFAIPYTLDPSIIMSGNGALNPIRPISRVITISTHDWKGVSSDGVTAAYVPEATEATDASPVLAQPAISTQQGRAFVPFSIELGQDWNGLQDELTRLITDARDVLDATKFLTGSGTNEPFGILTGLTTTQRVQTNTVATYAVGDPWLLKAQIPARFINSTTFAAAPGIWDTTYRFVGGNSTEPLQMPTRSGEMMGRPKVEWSTMVTTLTTGSKIMLGGDFNTGYTIVDRIGMTAELIPHLFGATNRFPTGQRGLYTYWRTGANVVVANAFRYLEVK
jgi:HK97 family phage major capsid protein